MCELYKVSELRRVDNSPSISSSTINKFYLLPYLKQAPSGQLPSDYFGTSLHAVGNISFADTEPENLRTGVNCRMKTQLP